MDQDSTKGQQELDPTAEYLELYRRLEAAVREKYGDEVTDAPVWWLAHKARGYRGMTEVLDYIREVRNVLQHRQRLEGDYAVVPSEGMLSTMRRIVERVEKLPCAYDLCTKTRMLLSAGPHDGMRKVMRGMVRRGFSHVPILEDGRVVGVLSERTLASYLLTDTIVEVDQEVTLDLVARLLPLDAHGSEVFAFVARDALATDVAAMFQDALERKERLGAVFVTHNGKQGERLLGMLTSWDMAAFF